MSGKSREPGVTTRDVAGVLGNPVEPGPVVRAADSVPEQHKGDVERLLALQRETEELRTKLSDAGVVIAVKPHKPSFGLSQGTREELERTGKATDPFTGEKLTRDDLK